jgi:sec-independent protein translocase protein TatB
MVTPPPIQQANLGMADSLLLMVLALVVFGPRRLPQIGKQIGKLMYEFRKASNDFKFQMEEELRTSEEADRRKREEAERQQRLALTAETQPAIDAKADSQPAEAKASVEPTQEAGPASDSSTAEASGQENIPRVMPPLSGEIVGTTRAGRASINEPSGHDASGLDASDHDASGHDASVIDASESGAASDAASVETPAENEATEYDSRAVTEQASRHG